MEIDFSKNIVFKTMEGDSMSFPIPKAVQLENGKGISYQSPTGGLKVEILNEVCQDNMSGAAFQHRVNLELKSEKINYTKVRGCGNYKGIYRLNGHWILSNFDEEEAERISELPSLSFDLNRHHNKYYVDGFDGCNSQTGEVFLTENTLYFGNLVSTELECLGDIQITNDFQKILTSRSSNVEFLSDDIVIFSDNEIELEFTRRK